MVSLGPSVWNDIKALLHADLSPVLRIKPGSEEGVTQKVFASAGNRTRAARVAGEHSTTEPPMQVTT